MIKRLYLTFSVLLLINVLIAQPCNPAVKVMVTDTDNMPQNIPYLGEKVLTLFYIDPDVSNINEPLFNALKEKNFSALKFCTIGVVNCKDTWIPNSIIRTKAHQKQELNPKTVILPNKNNSLARGWGLGNCDNRTVVIVVGKDSKIKFSQSIKSREESKNIIPLVLKTIEDYIDQ
jgi:predicted transcriptional regulator